MIKYCLLYLILNVFVITSLYAQSSLKSKSFNKYNQYGKKEGTWQKVYSNGKVKYTGQFNNDVPKGVFKYYYDNGALKSEIKYIDNDTSLFAIGKIYNNTGKLIASGFYRNMKKDSVWNYYKIDENSQSILMSVEKYRNNQKNGTSLVYFANGIVYQEVNWENDTLNGLWKDYYSNGNLKWEGNYINGKLQGKVKGYHSNGSVSYTGQYNSSFKDSVWVFYKENEEIIRKVTYRRSNIVKVDGEPFPKENINNKIDESVIYEGFENLNKGDQ
ncbi:MAG: hypothetical protein A2X12_02635 [Bacteroidetes bacterium GWE2_29_8]|nr:MAG: hypothetical protein A2X12_02635 [Bacteroidetes bacterium GWE2_29_8]OFY22210.1 MAG: hypothetical protein A2X02_00085 [Bacteroidetes bacterium GWF2_29_10]